MLAIERKNEILSILQRSSGCWYRNLASATM